MSNRGMQNLNTRRERLTMWATWHLFRWGSPSLRCLGLRPTLRWALTGWSADAAEVKP